MRILLSFFVSITIAGNINAQNLKIITFNIGGDYKGDIIRWEKRMPLMTEFLREESPDILCLQEAHSNQSSDIIKSFPMLGIVGAQSEKEKLRAVYNPILYRKDRFIMLDSGYFALSEHPDSVGSIGWDAKYPRKATWINLKSEETGEIVFVINAHLDNVGKVAKVEGIKLILDKIRLFSKSRNIILAGDFNSTVSSKVHDIVSEWGLYDTYQVSPQIKGVHYSFHQYGQKDIEKRHIIDFVFTDKEIEILSVNIPKESSKSGVYISDHCPVIVNMKL